MSVTSVSRVIEQHSLVFVSSGETAEYLTLKEAKHAAEEAAKEGIEVTIVSTIQRVYVPVNIAAEALSFASEVDQVGDEINTPETFSLLRKAQFFLNKHSEHKDDLQPLVVALREAHKRLLGIE